MSVLYHAEHASASYGGLAVCGSVWVCPMCAAKIAAKRGEEIRKGAEIWHAKGGQILMLTLTLRHQRLQKLSFLLKALNAAYRFMRNGGAFMAFKEQYKLVGSITSREITEGKSGWHPHLHGLLFIRHGVTDKQRAEMKQKLYDRWIKALKRQGVDATYEHGIALTVVEKGQEDYVTKVSEAWAASQEMVGALQKEGRRGSRTPAKLLALAAAGDQAAGRLFVEYAAATRGSKMVVWSIGLRKELFNDDTEKSEQELAEEKQAEAIELFVLCNWQWQIILKHKLRGELLAECCAGDIDTPVQFLAGWGIELASWQLRYTIQVKNSVK